MSQILRDGTGEEGSTLMCRNFQQLPQQQNREYAVTPKIKCTKHCL